MSSLKMIASLAKRSLIAGGLLAGTLATAAQPAFAASASFGTNPSTSIGHAVNDDYTLDVVITVDQNSNSYQFGLTWDPNIISITPYDDGSVSGNPQAVHMEYASTDFLKAYVATLTGGNSASVKTQNDPAGINNTTGKMAAVGAFLQINSGSAPGTTASTPTRIATVKIHQKALGNANLKFDPTPNTGSFIGAVPVANTTFNNPTVYGGTPPLPDLQVPTASVAQSGPDPIDGGGHDNFTVTYTVQNFGGADAGSFVTRVSVNGTTFEDFTISSLAAGATSAPHTTPIFAGTPGTIYNVTVHTNQTGSVTESNTTNNDYAGSLSYVQYAGLTATQSQTIDGNTVNTLILTQPANITGYAFQLGKVNNLPLGMVEVQANVNWALTVKADNNGRLTKYAGTPPAYDTTVQLIQPLQITGAGCFPVPTTACPIPYAADGAPSPYTSTEVDGAVGSFALSGAPTQFTANTFNNQDAYVGNNYQVALSQYVGFNDKPVPAGTGTYHTSLTWVASQTP